MSAAQMDVEEAKKITGRNCGDCSLCCRLLDVEEAGKASGKWCPHCAPGQGGCAIYPDRPQVCRDWACGWLVNPNLGDGWYPRRCGIVVDSHLMENGSIVTRFHVDPRQPDTWRKEPFYSEIKQVALRGLRGDAGVQYATVICIVNRPWLLVLPHRETEWVPGVAVALGPDRFEFIALKSYEAAKEFRARLAVIEGVLTETRAQHPGLGPMDLLARATPKLSKLFGDARP